MGFIFAPMGPRLVDLAGETLRYRADNVLRGGRYIMAHIVLIEDSQGDVTDVHWYCSDSCAKSDERYAGWNGCIEIHDAPQLCVACGDRLGYYFTHPRTHVTRYVAPNDEDYTTAWRWV